MSNKGYWLEKKKNFTNKSSLLLRGSWQGYAKSTHFVHVSRLDVTYTNFATLASAARSLGPPDVCLLGTSTGNFAQ